MTWLPDKYESSKTHFISSDIPEKDKTEICKLVDKLLATKIKRSRATKYYDSLRLMVERGWIPSYHGVTDSALYHCLTEIEQDDSLGMWAKRDYRLPLKLILKELNNSLADIIKPNKGRNKQQLPQAYLTVHDILKMVQCDWPHLRDKSMIVCLYESCCRPHEFFTLERDDVKFEIIPAKIWDGNGGQIKINLEVATLFVQPEGKTGARPVPLVWTVPWLKAWLRERNTLNVSNVTNVRNVLDIPKNIPKSIPKEENDYIWTKLRGANKNRHIEYPEARKAMKQIANAAGIPAEIVPILQTVCGMSQPVSVTCAPVLPS